MSDEKKYEIFLFLQVFTKPLRTLSKFWVEKKNGDDPTATNTCSWQVAYDLINLYKNKFLLNTLKVAKSRKAFSFNVSEKRKYNV